MFRVDLRNEFGNIISREFNTEEDASDFYYETQLEFKYIEMRLSKDNETLDYCFMANGTKLKPVWLED